MDKDINKTLHRNKNDSNMEDVHGYSKEFHFQETYTEVLV